MTYRLRNIVLAVALATLAAVLTSFYVSNYKKSVQDGEENVTVFVAKRDIPAGTSGAEASGLLRPVEIARRSVVPGAITSRDQIKDLIATDAVYAEEQVSARRFRPIGQGGVRAELKGNLRAFQLTGDPHQLLAGTVKKGDRVDVVANFKFKVGDEDRDRSATRVILRDLLVLKAPSGDFANGKLSSSVGTSGSVQLAVTDGQAQKLFFAYTNGNWHLDLRGVVDATDSPESLETLDTMLCDGMRRDVNSICGRGTR
ncbi:MAG: Flp pilus assembly protein CpaB [Gaiellaceae bacterium]